MYRALLLFAVLCTAAAFRYRPPVSQGCHYNGRVYNEGQVIPDQDPCTHCVCRLGQRECVIQDCAPLHCYRPVRPPGQCCPQCRTGFHEV